MTSRLFEPRPARRLTAPSGPMRRTSRTSAVSCWRVGRPEGPAGWALGDVRGRLLARRALEITAAGAHNLLLVGPPGAGKTMIARRMAGVLPPLAFEEALEVT